MGIEDHIEHQDIFKKGGGVDANIVTKIDFTKITRLEIIDHTKPLLEGGGRVYSVWTDEDVFTPSVQDGGRTLKIFLTPKDS
jgi:hypothetical protein